MSSFSNHLAQSYKLHASDTQFVDDTLKQYIRRFEAGQVLVEAGTAPKFVHLILGGWAYRYKRLRDSRRQIIAFVIPEDISDLDIHPIARIDHDMSCLTPVVAAEIPRQAFEAFFDGTHPRIAQTFKERAAITASIQREWTVNLGARSAAERIAHLLCEMFYRLRNVGMTVGNQYTLPLTQANLADAAGLSLVHVNKSLRELRSSGLVFLKSRVLIIPNLSALEKVAFFDVAYLNVHDQDPQLLRPNSMHLSA